MLTASHAAIAAAALTLSVSPLAAQTEEPAKAQPSAASSAPANVDGGPVTAAAPTDFRTGIEVRDARGDLVGTVESVDSEGAIVFTGNLRAKLPFQSFGKNRLGLVISLSRADLEAAASAQQPG